MTSGHKTFIQINSGDFTNVGGSSQSFRNTLATPLILNKDKAYEIAVWDAFFPIRQTTSSVYVNTNLVTGSIVGSQLTQSILFIPFSEFSAAIGQEFYYQTALARKWFPLAVKNIPYVDISFTLSTGAPMPVDPKDYSTITLAIREITY